jgi:1-acyl-sn-glycerol-3-phosphate acyltransferase
MKLGTRLTEKQDPRNAKHWFTEPTLLTRIGRPVAARALPFLADITLTGTEHLPLTGPFILAANHVSALDSVILEALLPRYPYFMAKSELFRHPLAALLLRYAGAFPVERKGGDEWAILHAMRVLEKGQVLGIYPEGTRSQSRGTLGRAKTGAVRIALQKDVPIVPVAIWGTDTLFSQYRNPLRPPPVSVRVGKPFEVTSRVTDQPISYDVIRELTTELMTRIADMLPKEKRGEYAH